MLRTILVVLVAMGVAESGAADMDRAGGWRFGFRDFVIAAWSPPSATDAEYEVYRECGFNLVMSPRYSMPQECLDIAARHGLKVMVDTYTPNDEPWGGAAAEYTPHPTHHPATVPELKWLHERAADHPALAGYLLGDDYGVIPRELVDTTSYLRENAPELIPWICQNVMSAESLAKAGNPIQNPQIYPTLYQSGWPAEAQGMDFCRQLEKLRQGCEEFGLTPWPMFNVSGVTSDSLLRFQVYASLAYGAQGIWYFTYKDHGGIQTGGGYETVEEVRANLRPLWEDSKEANLRVAGWGPELLGRKCAGVFHTGWGAPRGVRPAEGKLVEAMPDHLLAGVLVEEGKAPLAVIVDKRLSKERGEVEARDVTVRFAEAVDCVDVLLGDEPTRHEGRELALKLRAGEGALLRLEGERLAALCEAIEQTAGPEIVGEPGEDGMVLHLTFDEGEGEVAKDTCGLGNDAALGGVEWVEGKHGTAISFEEAGASGAVWQPKLPARDEMTLAAWVKPVYPEKGYGPILYVGSPSSWDRFEFGLGPDNIYPVITDKLSHSHGQLYVAGMKELLPEGKWGHIAVAAGQDGATVYVNGEAVQNSSYKGRFDFDATVVQLGFRLNERYTGALDEVRVYARKLTAEEVAELSEGD